MAHLDRHEGTVLPDMALLAMLQHNGAATPLLDVSLDPIIALYMAVVSPNPSDDDKDGILFAITKPTCSIDAFDSRNLMAVYDSLPIDGVCLYSAPDVSDRLRIQRGHFLMGKVNDTDARTSLPIKVSSGKIADTWLARRMASRGTSGLIRTDSEVGVFRIPSRFKASLRKWLEDRSGITKEFVFPTEWHNRHLGQFATSHGRTAHF